jgi:hypothetical protein
VVDAFRDNLSVMAQDIPKLPGPTPAYVVGGDARCLPLANASVGGVLFSPPYPNRYDYSAIYQLELAFGKFVCSEGDLREVRKSLLRSHLEAPEPEYDCPDPAVLAVLRRVYAASTHGPAERGRTMRMLVGYFGDMYQVLTEISRVALPGAPVGCVVATQTYFGQPVPTDLMVASLAQSVGLQVEAIWVLRHKNVAVQQRLRAASGAGGRESVLLLRRAR